MDQALLRRWADLARMMNKKEKKELYFLEQDIKRIKNKLTEHEACLLDFIETCRKPYHNEQEIVIKELDN